MSGDRDPVEWASEKEMFEGLRGGFAFGGNGRVQVASLKRRYRWTLHDIAVFFLGLFWLAVPFGIVALGWVVSMPEKPFAFILIVLLDVPAGVFFLIAGFATWAKA